MVQASGPESLREVVRALQRNLGKADDLQLSCCGITFTQCHTIVELGRAGCMSLNDLATILGLDKSTMSRTVDNLVGKGLVEREPDAADRRFVRLGLTDSGRKTYSEIENTMDSFFRQVYEALPEARREQVLESIHLLVKAMKNTGCC